MKNKIAILVVAILTSAGASSLQAGHISIRIGGFSVSAQVRTPPVYVAPRVVVEPVPVFCAPPPVVFARPAYHAPPPVYVAPAPCHRVPVFAARVNRGHHRGHDHHRHLHHR